MSTTLLQENTSVVDIIEHLCTSSKAKFNESIDVAIRLHPPKKKVEVRGVFPYVYSPLAITKTVAVFTSKHQDALEDGADAAGIENLMEEITNGQIKYDYYVASPQNIESITKIARILGPKFPSRKNGTLSEDIKGTIKMLKTGVLQYKADKTHIIHGKIGAKKMDATHIAANLHGLFQDIIKTNPKKVKEMIKSVYISSTMGAGINIPLALLTK